MSFDSPGPGNGNAMSQKHQPFHEIILSKDTVRTSGDTAVKYNISAGRAVGDVVRRTLGPDGLDKMLVDSEGDVVVTNNGALIVEKMSIDNPAADMVVEVADAQAKSVGDGTTAALILSSELLIQAEELMEAEIHPSLITQGYRQAVSKIDEYIQDIATEPTEPREHLHDVARSTLTGRGVKGFSDQLAEVVVDAVLGSIGPEGVDTTRIEIHDISGRSISETKIIPGVILENPTGIETIGPIDDISTVALIEDDLIQTGADVEYSISDLETYSKIRDNEEIKLDNIITTLTELNVDLLLSTTTINPAIRDSLVDNECAVVSELSETAFSRVRSLTEATSVTNVAQISPPFLGEIGTVTVEHFEGQENLIMESHSPTNISTVVSCGETDHVVASVHRAIKDAIAVVARTTIAGQTLPGGGATHVEIAHRLRDFASSIAGKQQLAIEAFADSLDVIPRILAENAGHDPIDTLVDLRAHHDSGNEAAGVATDEGVCEDMRKRGVVSPPAVIQQAIENATDAASLVLRIDDIISSDINPYTDISGDNGSDGVVSGDSYPISTATIQGNVASPFETLTTGTQFSQTSQTPGVPVPSETSFKDTSTGSHLEEIESISTPSWIPPREKFPLRIQWSGVVSSISINHKNVFEVIDLKGGEPQVETTYAGTEISGADLGDHGNLIVYLKLKNIPQKEINMEITSEIEFESGKQTSKTISITINRANLSANVTNPIKIQHLSEGIKIALRNSGSLRANVAIDAKVADESIVLQGGTAWNLLNGFLNIGIHRKYSTNMSDSNVSDYIYSIDHTTISDSIMHEYNKYRPEFEFSHDTEVDNSDLSGVLFKRSCKNVIELIESDVPVPTHYDKEDIMALQTALEKMLAENDFSLLYPHLDDIKLAYLDDISDRSLHHSITLESPIESIRIPENTDTIELEIQYEDESGTVYEPIRESLRIVGDEPQEGPQRVSVSVQEQGDNR